MSRTEPIESVLLAQGLTQFGFAALTTPFSMAFYESWLERGHQGDMHYLKEHAPLKREPQRVLPRARSAIVVALDYVPHPAPMEEWPFKSQSLQVARYAEGRDYHHFLKGRMDRLADELRALFPDEQFLTFVDSGPVLERDLARRAQLGWIGKNTCLLNRKKGSLFFITEIYTTLDLATAEPVLAPDHCGTCTRCIDACPTGALIAPRELDARKCISYLTIETKLDPPLELREKMGSWFFGCDICQTVCPWNLKTHGKEALDRRDYRVDPDERKLLLEDLRFVLTSSNRALERAFKRSPLARANGLGLKRNALIVCANSDAIELLPVVEDLTTHARLGDLASWARDRLKRTTQ